MRERERESSIFEGFFFVKGFVLFNKNFVA